MLACARACVCVCVCVCVSNEALCAQSVCMGVTAPMCVDFVRVLIIPTQTEETLTRGTIDSNVRTHARTHARTHLSGFHLLLLLQLQSQLLNDFLLRKLFRFALRRERRKIQGRHKR